MLGRVNHVKAETAQEAPAVVLDMFLVLDIFLVNSKPASVLFNFGASHSFITNQFVAKHNLPMHPMKQSLLVSFLGKEMKPSDLCLRVNMKIMGVDFLANLIVLKSCGIDVMLGMNWLVGCDGVI